MTLSLGPRHRPTGDAFAEFDSTETAKDALSFNRKTLMGNTIELFPCNADEMRKHTDFRALVSGELGPPPGGFLPGTGPSTEDARKKLGPPPERGGSSPDRGRRG